ncbi:MAG TPA: hypothetical protein VGO50_15800 [Pyrinomonadaceae bacterium]|jgi:hypothetical protein|nr:hypothetical protein [Pyrinomonadaceae bacterium]
MYLKFILMIIFIFAFTGAAFAQIETLTNVEIVEMTKVGLDKELIKEKINISKVNFDTTTNGLIELRKANVDNEVIKFMMDKSRLQETAKTEAAKPAVAAEPAKPINSIPTPKEALLSAKTVAIEKDSIHPSIQALEKELMKRKDWTAYNLTLVRSRTEADIYIDIDFVTMSVITHRYTFHVYDRRTGTIIAAGETTSWGSLAENLAREISKKLKTVATPPPLETAKAN